MYLIIQKWFDEDIEPPTGGQTVVIGLVEEIDTTFAIGRLKRRVIGLNAETDTVFAMVRRKRVFIGQALEADQAFPITTILVGGFVLQYPITKYPMFYSLDRTSPPRSRKHLWRFN